MSEKHLSGREPEASEWQIVRHFFDPPGPELREELRRHSDRILFDLQNFLAENVGTASDIGLKEISEKLKDSLVNTEPLRSFPDTLARIVREIAPHAVNVSSPRFIGHMTSAIPSFMVHLHALVAALNQNVVKIETSKMLSVTERQVLAKIHRMIFGNSEAFYLEHIQNPDSTLGCFVEDGTLANITALWVARNQAFGPKEGFDGIGQEGAGAAFRAHDVRRCVVLVSRLGHYSLQKAGGVLGIGNRNILTVDTDRNWRIDMGRLKEMLASLSKDRETKILAVVGIAGATETGTVDPLSDMAELCAKHGVHFHADAAWGGPVLLSERYRHLLSGIEHADSVTIDGHKQFYMPMGCGMVYFRDPRAMDSVAYHSAYVSRRGSVDLGKHSLCGSRAATSLILGSALEIMGARGYAAMIEHGIRTARAFADEIRERDLFELATRPELNILTYRILPRRVGKTWASAEPEEKRRLNQEANRVNIAVQRRQRQAGRGFVSRTTLRREGMDQVVLRSVIMNPMTDMDIVREVLDEQEAIYGELFGGDG